MSRVRDESKCKAERFVVKAKSRDVSWSNIGVIETIVEFLEKAYDNLVFIVVARII